MFFLLNRCFSGFSKIVFKAFWRLFELLDGEAVGLRRPKCKRNRRKVTKTHRDVKKPIDEIPKENIIHNLAISNTSEMSFEFQKKLPIFVGDASRGPVKPRGNTEGRSTSERWPTTRRKKKKKKREEEEDEQEQKHKQEQEQGQQQQQQASRSIKDKHVYL